MRKSSKTALFIALRYLFSPKKNNIINIISLVSVLGITASAAALIIVLSVFNGLQDLVVSNFNRFNPPLKIEAKEGKVFSIPDTQFTLSDLEDIEGVKAVEQVLCDLVLITYNEKQTLTTLYGISDNFPELSGLAEMIIEGNFNTKQTNHAVFGSGVAALLSIELQDYVPVKLYYPKRNKKNLVNYLEAFEMCYAKPAGVFASFTPYDENAVFVSETLAKEIFDYEKETTFIAIYLDEHASLSKVQKKIAEVIGVHFTVRNQMQQEELLYKTIQAENLMVYLILCFILIIATFNIIGILAMLIIEKKQDISILHTLGATKALLKKVFLMVGAMIGFIGSFVGLFIGLICCLIQQHFEVITFASAESSYIISAYPVAISFIDFVVIFFLVILISICTSGLSLGMLKTSTIKNNY